MKNPYFFSAGWHFSQTFPALAALTQHLFLHFSPASTVGSQQGFFAGLSAAMLMLPSIARAQTIAVIVFINLTFHLASPWLAMQFFDPHNLRKPLSFSLRLQSDFRRFVDLLSHFSVVFAMAKKICGHNSCP